MKALVVGSGGREHALAWRLRRSPSVSHVYCVPGNAGVAFEASCVPAAVTSVSEIAQLAETLGVNYTVVGPEVPLVAGIVDEFAARNLPVVGPDAYAAQLEGSKIFAKEFMRDTGIPTAAFAVLDNPADIEATVGKFGFPVALKADGLAAGKGVVIVQNAAEARAAAAALLSGEAVGDAGKRVVVEQFLPGEELSFILLCDGEDYVVFAPTQDHKAAYDHDQGPNTGGMGAYCDHTILPGDLRDTIISKVVEPTLAGLRERGHPFRGFLYCGLMIGPDGPRVLEFNVRMGDPETQPILYRMTGDFGELLASAARGALDPSVIGWSDGPTACVVLASKGYPGAYEKGLPITGLHDAEALGARVFHAGTRFLEGKVVTAGGRVLGVTAGGASLRQALDAAYAAVAQIHFDGMHFRKDIGHKGLARYEAR